VRTKPRRFAGLTWTSVAHLNFIRSLAASKKEQVAEMIGRVWQAFLNAGLGEPAVHITLMGSSPIDRVLKRHPEMERFLTMSTLIPGSPTQSRLLTNSATGEAAEY
jgi:hypothetical protein